MTAKPQHSPGDPEATPTRPTKRPRPAARCLPEARALYRVLADGHPGLHYNVSRGFARRDARTGKSDKSSYVRAGTWQPAREFTDHGERDRRFNAYVLAAHLAGNYDVAWEAPSWGSLLVFDIDRHVSARVAVFGDDDARRDALHEATVQRDTVLSELWTALEFGPDKQPIILKTPSGGYHLYLPLLCAAQSGAEGRWPGAALRRFVEHRLHAAGVVIRPGRLEVFPTGVKLRAPCGRGTLLLHATHPDRPRDLRLEPVPGTFRGKPSRGHEPMLAFGPTGSTAGARWLQPQFEGQRDIRGLVRAFVAAVEAARRPLHEWLGQDEPLWHSTWGPFGAAEPNAGESAELGPAKIGRTKDAVTGASTPPFFSSAQHKEEVPPVGGGSSSETGKCEKVGGKGWLLSGDKFLHRIRDLTREGLTKPGERHDAALKLGFYFGATMGLPRDEVLARIRCWLEGFHHASNLREKSERAFVRQTLAEVAHYYDHHVVHCVNRTPCRRADISHAPLAAADRDAFTAAVPADRLSVVLAVLAHLKHFADDAGWVAPPVEVSHRTLLIVCGDRRIVERGKRRRAYLVALEELQRLGVLTLHLGYSVGHHARRFSVWYRFGSGILPARLDAGERLVAQRDVSEGVLSVVAPGDGSQRVELAALALADAEREADSDPADRASPGAAGRAWWRRMFAARAFTVAEFLFADESAVVAGIFPTPSATGRRSGSPERLGPRPGPRAGPWRWRSARVCEFVVTAFPPRVPRALRDRHAARDGPPESGQLALDLPAPRSTGPLCE